MSNQLDTRDLQEELEKLEALEADLILAKETLQAAEDALEEYQNVKDDEETEELRTLERELSEAQDAVDAIDFDETELEELRNLKDEVGGEWEYGVQLIPEDDFEDYCQELCEDIGDIPKDMPSYIVIDWEATCNNLRSDYSETTFRDETYLYRA